MHKKKLTLQVKSKKLTYLSSNVTFCSMTQQIYDSCESNFAKRVKLHIAYKVISL